MTYQKTAVIITILLITAFLTAFSSRSEKIYPNKPFSEFPLEIDSWKGQTGEMAEQIYNILGVEDYIIANYTKRNKEFVNLYVGYYQSQKEGDIIHSPKNCMPGAGWNIIKTSIETVPTDTAEKQIKVIKLVLQNGLKQQIVLYWFQSRGRIIASEYMQKIWLVIDSITKHRTDGSFVRLISPVITDEEAATKLLKEFAKKVYPILKTHIPS